MNKEIITNFKLPSEIDTLLKHFIEIHEKVTVVVMYKSGSSKDILIIDNVIEVFPSLFEVKDDKLVMKSDREAISVYNELPDEMKFLGFEVNHVPSELINQTFNFEIFDRVDLMNYVSVITKYTDFILKKISKAKDSMYNY